MAFNTGLEEKPWYFGAAIGLLLAGGLYWAANKYFLEPKKAEVANLESQLTTLNAKIQEGLTAQRQLPRFREEVRQLEIELDGLLRILPARRNTPDLIKRVRDLTEQGDFDLLRFAPGTLVEQEFYSEYPIGIGLEGGYHNLAQLFEQVSRFPRIINVDALEIKTIDRADTLHTLAATFVAKTFVYKEAAPVAEEPVG
ncbi:MAG: type 4a pilus biogenesis protein PilO [Acidobacteriota bacterium]|nr:type 4a pilus biogenesis protein PilO [Acidobacteriota bacterium]